MSEAVTVWGVKDTVTIPEQQGAILKATFTVINPEQISECPSEDDSEIDLDRVTFLKKSNGEYVLVRGKLEEVLAQSVDTLVKKKTITVSFGLEVRDCPLKDGIFGTNQTSNAREGLQQMLEVLRLKAVAQRAFS